MIQRLALLLFALLPLAACDRPAPTSASGDAPAVAANGGPVAGVDYFEIPNGRPLAPVPGKVEVAEAFGYPCPHCAHFEPILFAWRAKQPPQMNFVAVPAAFGGPWDDFARGFYAAEAAGLLDRTHVEMFGAIHIEHRVPPNASPAQIAGFYAGHGADADAFAAAMRSPAVEAKFVQARDFLARTEIPGAPPIGTPMMIVAGKYRVDVGEAGYEKMLDTVEKLVARENAAAR